MLTAHTHSLQDQLEDTHANLQTVKATLKETNSIVLPNLRMDTGRPWSVMDSPIARKGKKASNPMTPRGVFDSREEMSSARMDSF